MNPTYHIVGLTGSLRKASYNKSLLENAASFLPDGFRYTYADLGDIPLYNQDLEDGALPEPVLRLAELCRSADGVLISTPEYNGQITGVLKNALDWLSRNPVGTPLALKPVAIMGASTGLGGTARAQTNLRQLLVSLNMDAVNRPELLLRQAQGKFDAEGKLTDESSRDTLKLLVDHLCGKVIARR